MKTTGKRRSIKVAGLALGAATAGIVVGAFAPAHAALSNTSLVMSNNQVSSSSTYTAVFSTGTALVNDLILALPAGVSGVAGSNPTVYTASSCTGTFTQQSLTGSAIISGTNMALPININTLGTCVKVVLSGLTNPSSTGTSYACEADGVSSLLGTVTSGAVGSLVCGSGGLSGGTLAGLLSDVTSIGLNYVAQATNGVTTALNVAPALTTSVDNTYQAFNIIPSSTGMEASNPAQALTVATNAQNYTVEGLVSGSASQLTWVGPTSHPILFGYTESTGGSPAGCSGSGTAFGANGTYSAIESSIAGLTNGKATNIDYCWNVDYTDPAGLYTATVTYLVVPSF